MAQYFDVILLGSRDAALGSVRKQLDQLGLAAHAAKTATEAIWLLEAGQRFVAIFIDGESALPERDELLPYVTQHHPHVRTFLMLTAPEVTEADGCVVVDKLALDERVRGLLTAT